MDVEMDVEMDAPILQPNYTRRKIQGQTDFQFRQISAAIFKAFFSIFGAGA